MSVLFEYKTFKIWFPYSVDKIIKLSQDIQFLQKVFSKLFAYVQEFCLQGEKQLSDSRSKRSNKTWIQTIPKTACSIKNIDFLAKFCENNFFRYFVQDLLPKRLTHFRRDILSSKKFHLKNSCLSLALLISDVC